MPPWSQHVQKGRSAINTTTDGQPEVPAALFSHPQTQHANGKAALAGRQPAYDNLFQEPSVPAGRETLD